jgi:nucleotide-binding universal stress UspA family protein
MKCAAMKVMIACDGSSYAEAAINDVSRAGLAPDSEILVVSVVDLSVLSLPVSEFDLHSLASHRALAVVRRATIYKHGEIEKVKKCASKAADRLHSFFPESRIRCEVLYGKPAEALLRKAAGWKPDLIVLGTRGRSAVGRFFLGSVSREIAEKAACSVRIGRRDSEKPDSAPNKIIIGASSLPDAEEVIRAAGGRAWTENTEIYLIIADDGISAGRVSAVYPYAKAIFEQAVEALRATGKKVCVDIKSGGTEIILLEESEKRKADSILIADETAIGEKGLGKLATNLLARAKCTVEILRQTSCDKAA